MSESINTTLDTGLSHEMVTFYSDYLIDNAVPKLVHDQFGQKHPIPKNGGKTIQFRRYSPLPKATVPLTEGVTPDGQKLEVSTVESTVRQYGRYIELSDMLVMTSIDNNVLQATKLLGNQAGATLDTITREVLNGGTNVQYAEGQVNSRDQLVGGQESGNHYMTVEAIRLAARYLKTQNAEKIGDSYVAIIHPDVAYDLMHDPAWQNVKTYCDPEDMYAGEIGRIAGVRFVETTEAKIFKGRPLLENKTLTVRTANGTGSTAVTLNESLTVSEGEKLIGRKININGQIRTIVNTVNGGVGSARLTVDQITVLEAGDEIRPGEGGRDNRAVYATLVLGENAYGVTEIQGGGLRHIVKQLGSSGTADPLDQRASCGWKATRTAERLVEPFMVRIETCSSFDGEEN
jgi:N4-gp56 family major capsid protein